jgi:hypothetical protein
VWYMSEDQAHPDPAFPPAPDYVPAAVAEPQRDDDPVHAKTIGDDNWEAEVLLGIAELLEEFPCCHHEKNDVVKGHPPMMYTELICCIIKRARRDGQQRERERCLRIIDHLAEAGPKTPTSMPMWSNLRRQVSAEPVPFRVKTACERMRPGTTLFRLSDGVPYRVMRLDVREHGWCAEIAPEASQFSSQVLLPPEVLRDFRFADSSPCGEVL